MNLVQGSYVPGTAAGLLFLRTLGARRGDLLPRRRDAAHIVREAIAAAPGRTCA
jgi:hypothetical protein